MNRAFWFCRWCCRLFGFGFGSGGRSLISSCSKQSYWWLLCRGLLILFMVRYDSALLDLTVGLTILWVWFRDRRSDFSLCVLAAPLLMLLVPWQHNVFKLREATWQLNDVAGATEPFGLQYFYDNVGH